MSKDVFPRLYNSHHDKYFSEICIGNYTKALKSQILLRGQDKKPKSYFSPGYHQLQETIWGTTRPNLALFFSPVNFSTLTMLCVFGTNKSNSVSIKVFWLSCQPVPSLKKKKKIIYQIYNLSNYRKYLVIWICKVNKEHINRKHRASTVTEKETKLVIVINKVTLNGKSWENCLFSSVFRVVFKQIYLFICCLPFLFGCTLYCH